MKHLVILFFFTQMGWSQTTDYVRISQKLIESLKSKETNTKEYIDIIANANEEELIKQLQTDDLKKTFFINVYNGFTNYSLRKNPGQYKDRGAFFKSEQFTIAKNKVSLDLIEHGFLRKSSVKLSLGKLSKIFPPQIEKKYRVDKIDYRIHFALNCGAKSCPPVSAYDSKNINEQLDKSTKSYLMTDAKYDKTKNILFVPSLMSWFRGDFGNKKGILKICSDLKIIPKEADPKLEYNDYDWTLYLENFK
ncbi:DUF547 domain-containing protein [Flavobacterium sp. GSP14]|uniref:DUF547 domain-containing protein n=1 Tax=Flavobacterium sp. GSP14 TaxID=3401734 RepID=UPI003AAC0B62